MGRSYGDAAQLKDALTIDLKNFKKFDLNPQKMEVCAGSGLTFSELLQNIIPKGFFTPVSPGTKNITIGGAVACDVHGKNHHVDGSFGNHVKEISLIDGRGDFHKISKSKNEELFWATIGGMGLTGIIIEVTFSIIPISTSLISVDTYKFKDIDSLMNSMIEFDKKYKYSVAWIDSLNKKGRGVVTCGEHLNINNLKKNNLDNSLFYQNKSLAKAPSLIPNGFLNKLTVKAFNETWYRKSPDMRINEEQTIGQYFYPLDGIDNWNNIYGNKGFIQYQFVIPDEESSLIKITLETLRKNSAPSFLTVLKRFGDCNLSPISFPKKGWTLAIDIPANINGIYDILDSLDKLIADSNGRIYLAKDSRMSSNIFKATYKDYSKWRKIKEASDPKNIFYSDLAKRLLL